MVAQQHQQPQFFNGTQAASASAAALAPCGNFGLQTAAAAAAGAAAAYNPFNHPVNVHNISFAAGQPSQHQHRQSQPFVSTSIGKSNFYFIILPLDGVS